VHHVLSRFLPLIGEYRQYNFTIARMIPAPLWRGCDGGLAFAAFAERAACAIEGPTRA
jgi:hypothetical protein